MSTASQPREDVFPGYQLTERIGSGGYAEVWRARAPGGIDKAVKVVFGCYDDQLATQELKSLERIKGVRHPFVLSLERFEIVDGRLAILTELADMSLEQRAQQCRAQGLPGIPRDELLQFMADTAEALDYLAEKHSLQHLDIKPANLLISGEHVKVADFGLVKELASCTQNSMVAGMTPTYSSPEMFDDAPSPHSDQYSLAIVYQEMLTGVLPFPGRTTAQLANQHLRAAPQLSTLSEAERPIVARALAKAPEERFANCRAFVKALAEASSCNVAEPVCRTVPATAPGTAREEPNTPASTQRRLHASIETKSDIKPVLAPPKEVVVDVSVPDATAENNEKNAPTIYVAVGGVGIRVLNRLRDLLARHPDESNSAESYEMIAIDTDREELKNACSLKWVRPLSGGDTLHLPLKLPQVYREQGINLEWLSHRWLYNIPRSLETRGYRSLGRLALVDHADRVIQLINRKLQSLANDADGAKDAKLPDLRVVLIAGMSGGTGGGMAIDLANALRARAESRGAHTEVQAVFVSTCLENPAANPLSIANTYALLKELQFVSIHGNQAQKPPTGILQQMEVARRPFDSVYIAKSVTSTGQSSDDGLSKIAQHLALAESPSLKPVLQSCRRSTTPQELANAEALSLRTFGFAPLAGPNANRIDLLAKSLTRGIAQQWLEDAPATDWRRLERSCEAASFQRTDSGKNATAASEQTAVPPVESRVEKWRGCFGKFGSTQFANQIVSRICHRPGESRPDSLANGDPRSFVEFALGALATVCKLAKDAKNIDALSAEDQAVIENLSSTGDALLAKLIDQLDLQAAEPSPNHAEIDRVITSHCNAMVEEFLGLKRNEDNVAAHGDAQHALEKADIDLLQCGHDRRTLIVMPQQDARTEILAAAKAVRPTAHVVSADVDIPVVFCEASGIRPASVTRGLERVYPGIDEAARRLFTRIDLDWSK
jgi:serine/threonine protein kinase